MKNDSPAKFFAGIAAATLGRKASSGGAFDRAKYERLAQRGGAFGNLAQQVLDQNPVADPTTVAGAAPVAPVAPTADMSAGTTIDDNVMDQANPFEGKTFSIVETPTNMKGDAKPVFNESTSNAAAMMYGSPLDRQMSMPPVGTSAMPMEGPLERNAFTKAMADTGGDYEAAKEILKNK